jgi:hypothetical protein
MTESDLASPRTESLVDRSEAVAATRARLAGELGVTWEERRGALYRESASLQGDWLGVFVQPAVILHTASAVRMELRLEGESRSWDEYGQATIEILEPGPGRVAFTKTYNGQKYFYVGTLEGGALAGYWVSRSMPGFRGFFCFTRAELLTDASRAALQSLVLTKSTRRSIAGAVARGATVLGGVGVALAAFTHVIPVWGGLLPFLLIPVTSVGLVRSKARLRALTERWLVLLGPPPATTK